MYLQTTVCILQRVDPANPQRSGFVCTDIPQNLITVNPWALDDGAIYSIITTEVNEIIQKWINLKAFLNRIEPRDRWRKVAYTQEDLTRIKAYLNDCAEELKATGSKSTMHWVFVELLKEVKENYQAATELERNLSSCLNP